MSKRAALPIRQYMDELKLEAVCLAESIGGDQAERYDSRCALEESSLPFENAPLRRESAASRRSQLASAGFLVV